MSGKNSMSAFCRFHLRSRLSAAAILLWLAAGLVSPQPVRGADDAVTTTLKSLMDQIAPVLKAERFSKIAIGKFSSIAGTSAGPEIQLKLAEIIRQRGTFQIDRIEYHATIQGRIERLEVNGRLAVRIVAQLFDANNRPIGQFNGNSNEVQVDLTGQEAVPRLLGITSYPAGEPNARQRDKITAKAAQRDPCVIVDDSIVKADRDCPYGLQLLVKRGNEYVPVSPTKKGSRGNAFAPIERGEVFAVALFNYSETEAAVNLTLDGINCFAFTEGDAKPIYWLVPPAKGNKPGVVLVRGWNKNNRESYEFKQVGYPESAAKLLQIEPNEALGQICAQFSAALPYSGGARSAGLGDLIEDKKVSVKRDIGPLQATIVVRYERNPFTP